MADRGFETGMSMVETLTAAALTIVMTFVVMTLSISGTEAQQYSERINRVTEITQDIIEEMRTDVASSVRLFGNDAMGTAYANLCVGSNMPPAIASRLPTLESTAIFKKDVVGAEKSGNQLMFAKHAWTTQFRCISGTVYRVDVYRLMRYYLSREGPGPRPGSSTGLNLCKFVGEPMADGEQIDQITVAADQAEVLDHLRTASADTDGITHPRVELVWRLGQDPAVANTLRQILSPPALSGTPQSPRNPTWEIVADTRLSSPGMLNYRHFSVATNHARAAMGVARFSILDSTGIGFPHGFELQLIGPSGARQVMIHLSMVTTNLKGHLAFADQQLVSDARDI